jgi:4-hydroxy-3-polyprenylbenzoate decarboxylase
VTEDSRRAEAGGSAREQTDGSLRPRRIVVGISGASGAPYAKRLLEVLRGETLRGALSVSVVLSSTAEEVWSHECEGSVQDLGLPVFGGRDYGAPFASGSSAPDAMVIIPASMSTVARIALGISDNLLTRAADVMLKERKRLILVPRETPYSEIHLKNMLELTRAGAVIMPASPSFYGRPQGVVQLLDTVIGRVCDHLGLDNQLTRRWGTDIQMQSARGLARQPKQE